jgi:tRNA G18 (ribose-2'-O)-methylase SpoU
LTQQLGLLADGVENPGNLERIADTARLLKAAVVANPSGRLIAVENVPGARSIYGRRAARESLTLAVGNERRGLSRRLLAQASETVQIPTASRTVTTLNVAAAAAVAGWYVLRGSADQARTTRPAARRPTVLLCGSDHVEMGSSMRSAAAFGCEEVLLEGDGAGWFDGDHAVRREARAAARRHKNRLRVHGFQLADTVRFKEVVAVLPHAEVDGEATTTDVRPLARERIYAGRAQLLVIGVAAERLDELADLIGPRLRVATLGLSSEGPAPLRLVASIALAEMARQAGRLAPRPERAGREPRAPRWERELELAAPEGDVLELDPELLLEY